LLSMRLVRGCIFQQRLSEPNTFADLTNHVDVVTDR
jgi:hypothetical protein